MYSIMRETIQSCLQVPHSQPGTRQVCIPGGLPFLINLPTPMLTGKNQERGVEISPKSLMTSCCMFSCSHNCKLASVAGLYVYFKVSLFSVVSSLCSLGLMAISMWGSTISTALIYAKGYSLGQFFNLLLLSGLFQFVTFLGGNLCLFHLCSQSH